MKRQDIQISDFRYICDYYDANVDYSPEYRNFVMVRNISLLNDIAYDTDIYFIEKNLFDDIRQGNSEITTKIVFPTFNSNFGGFSKSYKDFSNIYNKDNFKLIEDGGIVAPLTDKYGNIKGIQCDKIRIYHPFNKSDLDYVVYVDNFINGIHFHYFCNVNSNLSVNSEKHIKINNDVYSEFIEILVPNLSFLFKENQVYFNDIYNINLYADTYVPTGKNQSNWITTSDKKYETYNFGNINEIGSNIPLSIILNPFIIQNNDGMNEKIYFKLNTYMYNNYSTFPVNILIYPYDVATYNNNIYLLNQAYEQNADTFVNTYKFDIISKLEFDTSNHSIAVINTFDFDNKYNEETNIDGKTIQEAYAEYNGLTLIYNDNGEITGVREYQGWYADEDDEFETDSEILCCGFQIDVATDYMFQNIIYSDYQEMPYIDDFSFALTHILDNWYNIPETLLIRIKYTDKYLGVGLTSDFIILNKEWLKYIINNDEYDNRRLHIDFTKKQNNITDMSWNKVSATAYNFNFIDKIQCIVNKEEQQNTFSSNSTLGTKIIYKPIFYRTHDLSSLSFAIGLKQNIGVNLSAYMSKVNNFKLCIEDFELTEIGRNDVYVIFNINAANLENTSGTYYILDDDDNYISSGSWKINNV